MLRYDSCLQPMTIENCNHTITIVTLTKIAHYLFPINNTKPQTEWFSTTDKIEANKSQSQMLLGNQLMTK